MHHPPALQLTVDGPALGLLDEYLCVFAEEVVQVVLRLRLLVDRGVYARAQALALGLVLIPILVDLGNAVLLVGEGGERFLGAFALLVLLITCH